MAVRFACRCGKRLKAPDERIGKKVLCPACGNPVTVPEESTVEVDEIAGGSVANLASDLLKRSAKRARDQAEVYEEQQEPLFGFDVVGTIKMIVRQYLLAIVGVVVACIGLYWLSSAVLTTAPKLPPLGQVTGRVTINDQPVVGALVTFHPQQKEVEGMKVASSMGRTDDLGRYTLTYTRDVEGAVVGTHTVTVQLDERGREAIAPLFNSHSLLVQKVKPGKNPPIDLKVARVRPRPEGPGARP